MLGCLVDELRHCPATRVHEGVALTKEIPDELRPPRTPSPKTTWQENHGNLLMGFVVLVFLVGGVVLIYRQNQFVPPRFPEANMIEADLDAVSDAEVMVEELDNVVRISVTGAANDFGSVKIAIYGSEQGFNDPATAFASESVQVVDGEASWMIPPEELPEELAIAAYHDENDDDQLNRNRLGIPSERNGFSRNARGLTGPPGFKEAVIRRPKAGETIDLSIR
jgi:uncharacterized protein (DUF2141 family)